MRVEARGSMLSAVTGAAHAAALVVFLGFVSSASAQQYPTKTIRLVVPYAAGGGIDAMARLLARNLSEMFERQVIVDNRAGAGTVIGAEIVARSEPDGYTLMLTNNALAANHTLQQKLPYDTLSDFAPIILAGSTPNVLIVHPSLPVNTAKEFVVLANARPGQIAYATAGSGTASYLAMELLKSLTGVKVVHVPYRGTAPALTGVLAGEAQAMVATVPATIPYIHARRLRALAVTSARRVTSLPGVPTMMEAGIEHAEFETWYGLFARAGVAPAIVSKLNAAVAKILAAADVKDLLTRLSIEPGGGTAEAFDRYFRDEVAKLARVIRASGARVE